MKRLVYLSLFLMIGLSLTLSAQPKMEIEGGKTYDWGDVKPEESPLHAKIKIFNKGDELLKIKDVNPSCGCTTAPLDKNEISPGEYATLDVKLRVDHYSGDVRKTVKIVSNDPQSKQVMFLKCNVVRPFKIFPRFLSFNRMYVGEESKGKVVLTNLTDKPLKIEDVQYTPENMRLNIQPGMEIPAMDNFTIEAYYTPKTMEPFSGVVKIITDNKEISPDKKNAKDGMIIIKAWGRIVGERKSQSKK